jgi:hypothetical protein
MNVEVTFQCGFMYYFFSDGSEIYLIRGKVSTSKEIISILTAKKDLRVSYALMGRNQNIF